MQEANEVVDNLDKRLQDYVIEMNDINLKEEQLGW